jgi:hypothetical protein
VDCGNFALPVDTTPTPSGIPTAQATQFYWWSFCLQKLQRNSALPNCAGAAGIGVDTIKEVLPAQAENIKNFCVRSKK